jgi:hypothetical protein
MPTAKDRSAISRLRLTGRPEIRRISAMMHNVPRYSVAVLTVMHACCGQGSAETRTVIRLDGIWETAEGGINEMPERFIAMLPVPARDPPKEDRRNGAGALYNSRTRPCGKAGQGYLGNLG